jgi:tRNA-dihydrouridine synthase
MQDVGVKALSIHGRTRTQLYKGEADWTLIAKVKNNPRINIPIFGNGDVTTPEKALDYKNRFGVDGIMIGRAAIGHPWVFREIKHFLNTGEHLAGPSFEERVDACKTHLQKSVEWKSEIQAINEMKRHYANYFKGLPDFKEYRMRLVSLENVDDISSVLSEVEEKFEDFVAV